APLRFISHGPSQDFMWFLQHLDQHAEDFRRSALEASLQHVLDRIAENIAILQKNSEELELAQKAFDLLIASTVEKIVHDMPYFRINQELEEVYYARSQGLRSIARWWAYPGEMLRGRRQTEVTRQTSAFNEAQHYLD